MHTVIHDLYLWSWPGPILTADLNQTTGATLMESIYEMRA